MSAVSKFKGANTNFSERGERITPCQREEIVDGKKVFHYEGPAEYRLRILKCTYKEARDKSEYYIADFEIVESSNPRVKPGARRNWMQPMTGKSADIAQTRVTEFVLAASGIEKFDPQVKELESEGKLPEMIAESINDPKDPACKNALKGYLVDVVVKQSLSKDGHPYIKPEFFPVKE